MIFFLFILLIVLAAAVVILFAMLFEATRSDLAIPLRKWRIAMSKRKEINKALRSAALAKTKRDSAITEMEFALRNSRQTSMTCTQRIETMGGYIIAEQCGEHIKNIRANNYHAKEKKILRSVEIAGLNGYSLPREERNQLARMLKQAHKQAIRIEKEREEQSRIKALMREDERAEREAAKEIREAEKETKIKEKALREALALLGDQHSEAVEQLRLELEEAQARLIRTKSMAQMTRAGNIYIISNIGSFGKGVFKVGMTRRIDPMLRVKELGDASVPFSFDVHAMFSCDDVPALEHILHANLHKYRVNKVNTRKEFFRIDLDTIIKIVEKHHGEVVYEADAEALEYIETLAIEGETDSLESKLGIPTNL